MVDILVGTLSRKELYEKIWDKSASSVAKEYDIPYTQLLKQVRTANIPIPPTGYWTKLAFGKPVEIIPLDGPADTMISIYKTIESIMPDNNQQNPTIDENADPVETIEQYGQIYNIYYREKLYQEVWEKPVVEVAQQYMVSDVTIHKICKSLDIPTPDVGYWAKVKAGKPTKQTPLPNSNKPASKMGIRTNLEPQPQVVKELLNYLSVEDKSVVLSVAMQIRLPDDNAKMHAKIIVHRKNVVEWHKKESRERNQRRFGTNEDTAPFLADTISESSLPRVCRIFDALIKAMEPLGCSLTDDLKFVLLGETVPISVSESKDKIDHIPTREENIQLLEYEEKKRRNSWASQPNIRKYDYIYNGKISFSVGNIKSLRDSKSHVIEERLGDILIFIYEASNEYRIQREEREAAELKRLEEKRHREDQRNRYNLEVEKTNALVNESDDFDIACKIRAYISVMEKKASLTENEMQWIEWAKQKADWYDPTIKRIDEFFGTRNKNNEKYRKLMEKSYSSWRGE